MPIDFGKLTDKITKRILDNLQGSNPDIQEAGEQAGEIFVDGIEQGLEDAASRIVASSVKITKAFRDLAKKITNQKDILNISLGNKDMVIDIDFSDVDINSKDFQKKIDEVFEKIKVDNAIEFDSKAAEGHFKNMIGMYTKYAAKLSKLQEQRPRLTNTDSLKVNAKEQLAIIDGIKEIDGILNQASDMYIDLPSVYFGDIKELRASIGLIEQIEKGEEKIVKQRNTNVEKIKKENKELKERNKLLEEMVRPAEENEANKRFASSINGKFGKFKVKKPDAYSAMTRENASNYIVGNYDYNLWNKWYSQSNDEARTEISKILENDIKMRNAALNQMWDEYKHLTGEDIDYKDFLYKNIPMYRGEPLNSQSESERALSFTIDPQAAEDFGNNVLKVWLRPIDTLGMANPTDMHQPEAEVMVLKSLVPEYDDWHNSLITPPQVEEEVQVKTKLAEANEKVAESQKKVNEATQGVQMTIDDIVPSSAEETTPKVEEEAKALDKVGAAAEKAANSKKKFAKANKEVSNSTGPSVKGLKAEADAAEEVAWSMTRLGTKSIPLGGNTDAMDDFNLPHAYMGEKGQDAVQMFAGLKSEIEEMTGKPVIIDFVSKVNDDGQLAAVGATLKYVNEEAGVTVKQFYKIEEREEGILVATQSQEKATLAASKAAKVFNTEMQQKLALEQIKTLEGQMGSLELDLTEVKNAARAINDKASLENFNLALRSAKEQAKQLKTELKGQNTLDTIASMERALLTLPSRLDEVQRRLKALGDIEGVDAIDDVLRSVNDEYQRFLRSDDSEEKVKLFRELTSSMVWANAEMRNLSGKNAENKRQRTAAANAEDAQKKAARESYVGWWKTALNEQSAEESEVKARQKQEQAYSDWWNKALFDREQQEKAKDERVIAARKRQEEAYEAWWQKALYNKEKAPNLKYGKTTANSVRRKLDSTEGAVDALGVTNPKVLAKLQDYRNKVKEVEDLREKFASDSSSAEDGALVKQFQKASYEAEQLRRGIKAVIDEEQKMMQMSLEQGFEPLELTPDQIANLENEMIAYANAAADGRVELKGWNDDHTKMSYTVTDSKGAVHEMTVALGQGSDQLYKYRTATKETGTLMQQIFKGIKVKAKELLSFVIGGGSVYKVIELFRQGIQYIKEIDLALTELKKVTDETEESYDEFLRTAAKTGSRLGATISAVTEATATFAKLGYDMKQATEMAEAAIVYKNVGDNIVSTGDAADSIISTLKGFGMEASEAMAIVDRFNEVGNRFAITSQGIGEALRLSASALNEGKNSLDESIALITAANEVVNDPSSVGTALKTLTLRLRGSKTELEEMGEDVTGMATTTSQLQAKLLALTGGKVDIMLDANTFKNSTQILREMAAAWEYMDDISRASALELMGGKRQANVLSALISNFDTVEKVIETSANSAGSALVENERWLDSIAGKIDQFNNSVQSLWQNLLGSDAIKDVIDWGTKIIKSLDTTEGKILAIVKAVALLTAFKKINPLDWVQNIGTFFAAFQGQGLKGSISLIGQYLGQLIGIAPAIKMVTAETIANTIATQTNNTAEQQAILQKMGLVGATGTLNAEKREEVANNIALAVTNGQMTVQMGQQTAAMLGYTLSVDAAGKATVALDATTKSFMATNPVGWILAIVSVVTVLITVLGSLIDTTEEVAKSAKDALYEYKNAQETLKTHKKTIEGIRKEYSELAEGVDALGNNVNLTTEEYERYNEIANQIAEMFPQMVSGYTAEGNAIISLKGNVEELTKAYEAEAQAARDAILVKQNDVFKNFKNNTTQSGSFCTGQYSKVDDLKYIEDLIDGKLDDFEATDFSGTAGLSRWFSDAGIKAPLFGDLEDYMKTLQEHLPEFKAYYRTLKATVDAEVNSIKPIINAYLEQDFDYLKLSDDAKNAIKSMVHQFDSEFYSQFDSATEMEAWITTNLVQPLQDADTATEFESAFDLQTKFNQGEVSVQDYENMVAGIISLIGELGLDNADSIIKSIKLIFDVDDSGAVGGNIQEAAKSVLDPSDYDKIKTLTKSELDIINQNVSEWRENAKWDETTKAWEIGEPVLMSWDELKKKIEETKSIVDNTKSSYSIESLVNIKDKLSGLGDAFDQFKEDGKVSIDTLSDLNEKFGKIDGFEDFVNVLGDSASTTEQVESAISDMASAYLATTDILSNVTDANRDFVVSQLKALGVTNPEEYLRNLQSVHSAMADEYAVDLSNYGTVEQMKQAISGDLYSILLGMENMTIDELATKYGDDLHNYASLEEAKTEAARREALKRQEILKGENASAGAENAAGWRDSQAVGKDEIKTGWWIFGKNKYEGKSYSEMEALANNGDTKAKEWVNNIQSTYDNMVTESTESAESAYTEAVGNINDATKKFNSIDDYVAQYNLKLKVDVPSLGDDEGADKKADDAFQREMDYWENRIAANQAKYEQLQNEIGLMEKKGQKADASFYEEQIQLENERKWLLEQQKAEAQAFLSTLEEGSEEWWEVANVLNDIEGELDSVTASLVDLQDAIAEIDTYAFEEFNTRLDNLTGKLETIRNLIAPDGEEDWFDSEGAWTEAGVAVLGSQLQQLEMYKQGYQETMDELAKYEPDYENNEAYYEALGIHSEQEYYDKTEELISQQYNFAESISDTEQSVVDMYESNIDAVEAYTETLIDSYNDYIDSVKEALDAERDLYDFKKNVQKQSKDIAAIERRIASLSGSTNKADIAERRKLEAELYGARESLNDTFYDHAKDSQNEALDKEAQAYETSMTNMIEGLRTSLEDATRNMDEFLMGVTSMVMYNADTILSKYEETNLPLTTELTNPWIKAQEAVGTYNGNALDLMNQWTKEGGFFAQFNASGTINLQSPWSAGVTAANTFKSSVSTVMSDIVSNIRSNVSNITSELGSVQSAYSGIISTAQRAKAEVESANAAAAAGARYTGSAGNTQSTYTPPAQVDNRILSKYKLTSDRVLALGYGPISLEKFEELLRTYQIKYSAAYATKQVANTTALERSLKKVISGNYVTGPMAIRQYAKGTAGTTHDEWAITDEPKFGDELVLVPGKDGNLSFMRKGTSVVPADLTANLMEWGQFTPDSLNFGGGVNVNMINNAVITPQYDFSFDSLVHVDNCSQETLKDLEKMVDNKIDRFSKELNYSIKRFAR